MTQIIIGPKKNLDENLSEDDISSAVKKIQKKLENSPTIILDVIRSCTRNVDSSRPTFIIEKSVINYN